MAALTDTMLRYRAWRGELRPPIVSVLTVARWSTMLLLRRVLFWVLYAFAILIFLFFFYGQYQIIWITQQTQNQTVTFGTLTLQVGEMIKVLDRLNLNGTPHTFGNFIWFEGFILPILLAVTGAIVVGTDFHRGSLSFFFAKPIQRWHYIAGKCLCVSLVVHLVTTIPAILLYIEAGLLYDWKTYYTDHFSLLLGVMAYGTLVGIALSLILVATAVWVRRTVPLIMVWSGVVIMGRMLANFMVEGQKFDVHWRLIDLWNNLYLVGLWCMQAERDPKVLGSTPNPEVWEAGLTILGVCAFCAVFLYRRIRAIEIVK